MKFNFWQWIGVLLLLVGAAIWGYKQLNPPPSSTAPTTAPSR